MVEIMLRKSIIVCCLALLFSAGTTLRAQETVVASSDSLYRALLCEDRVLRGREDSLVRMVAELREAWRENPDQQAQYAGQILAGESAMLALRGEQSCLQNRIQRFEQEWITRYPATPLPTVDVPTPAAPVAENQRRNLVDNICFAEQLPAADYRALLSAQYAEQLAAAYAHRLLVRYGQLVELKMNYDSVQSGIVGAEIFVQYNTLNEEAQIAEDSLASVWNEAFDNKLFAYNYLLEGLGVEEPLLQNDRRMADVQREIARCEEESHFPVLVLYAVQKRALLEYERDMAQSLGLTLAADSLQEVLAEEPLFEEPLPRIELQQRYFLEYEPVKYIKGYYTSRNPIPEVKVYAHGEIYRIQVGAYRYKQQPSIFRNATPLYWQQGEDKLYRYYVGGFATKTEADAAREELKKHGFRSPMVVLWRDGIYLGQTLNAESAVAGYRVEILSDEALSDEAKSLIERVAPTAELTRAGQRLYIVGSFTERTVAERLAGELSALSGKWEIKVVEMTR